MHVAKDNPENTFQEVLIFLQTIVNFIHLVVLIRVMQGQPYELIMNMQVQEEIIIQMDSTI